MSEDSHSCPSCGARVPAGADACDLCGRPVEQDDTDAPTPEDAKEPAEGPSEPEEKEDAGSTDEAGVMYCHECGSENPEEANFCSQCGTELDGSADERREGTRPVSADLPTGSAPSTEKTEDVAEGQEEGMTKHLLLVVGGGVMIVLALFFFTQWSQQYEWSDSSAPERTQSTGGSASTSPPSAGGRAQGGAAGPSSSSGDAATLETLVQSLSESLDGSLAAEVDSLRGLEENAQGARKRQLQAELVNLYTGAGAPGRAALLQTDLADATGSVRDQRRAADLLYKWMRTVQSEGSRTQVSDVARHVADAYAAVAEKRPDDLDARTRMGEAYLLTNNPMKGIQTINTVLEEDSTFVPARFQKGLALLQINRLDEAVRQFQKVMTFASEADPFYQQAKRAVEVIREKTSSSSQQARGTRERQP